MKITLTKLQTEGKLQKGDILQCEGIGECRVAYVRAVDSVCVARVADGELFILSGLNAGADCRMVKT